MPIVETLSQYIEIIESNSTKEAFMWNDMPNLKKEGIENEINMIEKSYDKKNIKAADILNVLKKYSNVFFKAYKVAMKQYYNEYKDNDNKKFYRGLSNKTYKNIPGIYRDRLSSKDEYFYFNEMQVRCPQAFSNMVNINKLTYMQHYGCPTRLLDITSNPLVALYFACVRNDQLDGVVDVFTIANRDLSYVHSDRIRMLSKLSEFNNEDQLRLLILSFLNIFKGKYLQSSNGRYSDSIVERFYHSVKSENSAFERDIIPLDLLKPIFVQVPKDNPRILKQDGAFIIFGLDIDEYDSKKKIDKYITDKIIIPARCKKSLLKSLENVGISQATLFPEVDQVADYLKKVGK